MLIIISMAKKLLEQLMKKNYIKQISKDLGWRKSLEEKEINHMSSRKDMIIHVIAGLIKIT